MKHSRPIYYFLTEDTNNAKERNEIEYLASTGRVVIVSRGAGKVSIPNVRYLSLKLQHPHAARALLIWSKLCYLFCRLADSQTDLQFPSRNIYSGGKIVRSLTNLWWRVKVLPYVDRLLPSYDSAYFAPVGIWQATSRIRRLRRGLKANRVVIHDALILRLGKFTSLISAARRSGIRTVGNVKSWDNPFYTQLATGADAYLVWSQSMWRDIARAHRIAQRPIHVWGARPFFNFAHALDRSAAVKQSTHIVRTVGYAAAYCDSIMVKHEVAVLLRIASEFARIMPDLKFLVRPYPTLPLAEYEDLQKCANISLMDIRGELIDRYGDGREMIRFGSDEERIEYLAGCDCFLSMATSFTIEAAMFGLPVVHFFMHPEICSTAGELSFFERVSISDHLDVYFNQGLYLARNHAELISRIKTACSANSAARPMASNLLQRLGIRASAADWNLSAPALWADLQSPAPH